MERIWAAVAFADIRGFGTWTSRAATSNEVKEPFIREFYSLLQDYVQKNRNAYCKYVGDGLLIIKEFTVAERKNGILLDYLMSLRGLTRKVRKIVADCDYPRPAGFRIRIAGGNIYKLLVVDPNDSFRVRMIPEYVEYTVNMAQKLLEVSPEIVALCTQNIGEPIAKKKSPLRVRPLKQPSFYPKGVNSEDVDGLRILSF